MTTSAFTTASLRWLARLAWLRTSVAGGEGAHGGCSAARRTVLRERHKTAALRRHCGSAQPAAVVVGNTWSLNFTAVRPRDYIEESGMGGGREQLVHHYVLVAAALCAAYIAVRWN